MDGLKEQHAKPVKDGAARFVGWYRKFWDVNSEWADGANKFFQQIPNS